MEYAVVIERAGKNYSAYVPDLPGCVATGGTKAEAARKIRTAIQFHVDGLREDGLPVPKPTSTVRWVSTDTPPSRRSRARTKTGPSSPRPNRNRHETTRD